MNKKERYFVKYKGDTRYEKVWEQMQLLGIEDITTKRQSNNGTVVWRLPIKNEWPGNQKNATFIEVASFKTGYVRNQNSGYSNYQLNKRKPEEFFYKDTDEPVEEGEPVGLDIDSPFEVEFVLFSNIYWNPNKYDYE